MSKSPNHSLLRIALIAALCIILGLLYWSSLLVENSLNDIKIRLDSLERKVAAPAPVSQSKTNVQTASKTASLSKDNLLGEDPYYDKILPQKLPPDFRAHGIRESATIGKPDSLHPFSNWYQVSQWYGLCVPAVARNAFGFFEKMVPDMAIELTVTGEIPEYHVTLRDNVYWQPLSEAWFESGIKLAPTFFEKHKVTAHDFKFYWDALMNKYVSEPGAVALRNFLDDIKEIEVIDDLHFIVRWKTPKYVSKDLTGSLRPLPRHVYQYFPDGSKIIEDEKEDTYRTSSLFALNFSKHWAKNVIVSCGGYFFDGMTERGIQFKRNPDHYFPLEVLTEGSNTVFRNSSDTIWQSFKEGSLDTYVLRPEQLFELETFLSSTPYAEQPFPIKQIDYVSRSYSYIGWNQNRELFQNKMVRRALTMAIDRERIIRQSLNGLGIPIHGTFYVFSPNNNPNIEPWPFDPIQAKKILAEEGWTDTDRDGIIDKNGKPFKFSLNYFVKNQTSKAIAEYVQTALKEIGIEVNLNGLDLADISKQFEDKDFDALMMAWALGSPPEDPRQLWHSSQADLKGSSNAIGFRNSEADEIIDRLEFENNPEARTKLYHRFDEILHEQQPYTFLFTPKERLLYRSYIKNVFLPNKEIPGANIGEPDMSVSWIEK